jgi:phosphonate metabolism protein PhnN/1,5-bisphosphokinase (PRPP-forming)
MARGTLFLIVGPSGAGKDSLIAGAHRALDGDPGIVFAQRVITRPAGIDAEPHRPVDADEFAALRDGGGFMLHWRAHDTDYGIPKAYAAWLAEGASVVANVSRTVLAAAHAAYPPVRAVEITAPDALRAARLSGRGRENGAEAAARLARVVALPDGVPSVRIENAGALQDGIDALVAVLRGEG